MNLQAESTKTGLRHLIKEMYKAEVKTFEKEGGEKPKPIDKNVSQEIKKDEKKAEKTPEVTDKMKEIVQGFFKNTNNAKKEKPAVDLYVGRGRKRPSAPKKASEKLQPLTQRRKRK
jgi:hypothetical protein